MAVTFRTVVDCLRRFLRIILISLNILGSLCGLAIMITGAWALAGERSVVKIASGDTAVFSGVPILMVVLGVFLIILGGIGVAGSIFNKKLWGRIMLISYCIILSILIIIEFIGGIVAATRKADVAAIFEKSADESFKDYEKNKEVWRVFQIQFECCGVNNVSDYDNINYGSPKSVSPGCCNNTAIRNLKDPSYTCANATEEKKYLWKDGCVIAVKDSLAKYFAALAAIAIIFAIIQIVVAAVSIFVAVEKKGVKYDVMTEPLEKSADPAESS